MLPSLTDMPRLHRGGPSRSCSPRTLSAKASLQGQLGAAVRLHRQQPLGARERHPAGVSDFYSSQWLTALVLIYRHAARGAAVGYNLDAQFYLHPHRRELVSQRLHLDRLLLHHPQYRRPGDRQRRHRPYQHLHSSPPAGRPRQSRARPACLSPSSTARFNEQLGWDISPSCASSQQIAFSFYTPVVPAGRRPRSTYNQSLDPRALLAGRRVRAGMRSLIVQLPRCAARADPRHRRARCRHGRHAREAR